MSTCGSTNVYQDAAHLTVIKVGSYIGASEWSKRACQKRKVREQSEQAC